MLYRGRGSLENPTCRECRKQRRQGTCEWCGEQFDAYGRHRDYPGQFCSLVCWGYAQRKYNRVPGLPRSRAGSKASSRARKLNRKLTWDGVTDEEIFERDGWICQIPGCGEPIPPLASHPDPLSASIDHIVPISLGGDYTAANGRAAHLGCNEKRRNVMHESELALAATLEQDWESKLVYCNNGCGRPLPLRLVAKGYVLCPACRKAQGQAERQAEATARVTVAAALRQRVLECRERGMTWKDSAAACGLSGPGAAFNVAYPPGSAAWAARPRREREPTPDLEERLWWTTVRP
jgi:HNH endonuclease